MKRNRLYRSPSNQCARLFLESKLRNSGVSGSTVARKSAIRALVETEKARTAEDMGRIPVYRLHFPATFRNGDVSICELNNRDYQFKLPKCWIFEQVVDYCEHAKRNIPISFLLGFFVSGIVGRWFLIFPCIPWMNRVALDITHLGVELCYLQCIPLEEENDIPYGPNGSQSKENVFGADVDRGAETCVNAKDELSTRKIRITLMRYVNLAWILLLRLMSDQTSKRFSVGNLLPKSMRTHHFYHPWSIGTEDEAEKPPKRFGIHGRRENAQPCPSPCSLPTPSPEGVSFPQFNAFKAADDNQLTETLRAFNNDKSVRRTFGELITEEEINTFQSIASDWYERTKTRYTPEYWVPIQWAQRLTVKALQCEYIPEPKRAYHLLNVRSVTTFVPRCRQLNRFRDQLQYLQIFSSMMVPLAYAQVVTIAVYSYFTCQLFSSQFVERRNGVQHSGIDLYVPVFDFLSYLFLMGWYKVALCVINPFGDDDEDFHIGDILDYNLEVSYRSVYMDDKSFPRTIAIPMQGDEEVIQKSKDQFNRFLDSIDPDLWMEVVEPDSEENRFVQTFRLFA
ncbi:unnamed protein product [Echinostoma caproni]|uniref:Bestrophin homolog n=1 Tax=Echinostoma caproni TaxID=27848 RepID=A0A183AA39_9TREM|nr:unnamed protein product [Echinostoma caproni]